MREYLNQTNVAKSIQSEKQNLPQLIEEFVFVAAFGLPLVCKLRIEPNRLGNTELLILTRSLILS